MPYETVVDGSAIPVLWFDASPWLPSLPGFRARTPGGVGTLLKKSEPPVALPPMFHSMPSWRSASASTSTSFAVISISGVVESSSVAIFSTLSRLSVRSLTIRELVRFSTRTVPRRVSAACSATLSSAAFA